MLKTDEIEEMICAYYDGQMSENELFAFESRMAISKDSRDYIYQKCFEYFKISSSIKRIKEQTSKKSDSIFEKLKKYEKSRKLIDINAIIFKSINEFFGNISLHIPWNNP